MLAPPMTLVTRPDAERGVVMLSILSGLIVGGFGAVGLWYFKPRNGVPHPMALMPVLEWALPIVIITALSLGIGLVATGVYL